MIAGRFAARAQDFGFAIPSANLRIKLVKAPTSWALFLQSTPGTRLGNDVDWLPQAGLLRVELGSRNVLRADYRPLPEAWARTFHGVSMDFASLGPDGKASVTVTGIRSAIAAFARRLYGPTAPLELVRLQSVGRPAAFLTIPQDEALRAAVSAGYYRIPRSLNLDQLAKTLGISSASLSERLRRAEGRIITRYVDAGTAGAWDGTASFDETPSEATVAWPDASPDAPVESEVDR